MGHKLVIFDFDGVISDSWNICFETTRIWYPQLTEQQYRDSFNGNIRDASWRKPNLKTNFYDYYDPRLLASKPFEGISEVILTLAKDYKLFIVSSTPAPVIREYLRINDMDVFEQVLGHETHKYKDAKLKMILDETKVSVTEVLFITDTLGDILESQKVGVRSISVTWGFQSKETLLRGNPADIVEHPNKLIKSVNNFFNQEI